MNPALVLALMSGLVTASGILSALAALDVSRVAAGEWWRVGTCHLAHLSWRHYLTDATAFVALSVALERRVGRKGLVWHWLSAAAGVSIAVIVAGRHDLYGGLSGISCSLLAALILRGIREGARRPLPYLIGLVFCCYLGFMGGWAGGVPVAREAHLAGAAVGFWVAAVPAVTDAVPGASARVPLP